jgi:hypothetical protein
MWFENLMGFQEQTPDYVREHLEVSGNTLTSKANGRSYIFGQLEMPSLGELKLEGAQPDTYDSKVRVSEEVGNIQAFHGDEENQGAMFQAASQFNLLEMVHPRVTPEEGVGIYAHDFTQGPACAIACGAGTIYRNYLVPVNGHIGQSKHHQLDCLADMGKALGNKEGSLWEMRNGYALASSEGLEKIGMKITNCTSSAYEALKNTLRIGIQKDTAVTLHNCRHLVSQAYCSALPVAYSALPAKLWEPFARLVLEATYEATLHAALQNFEKNGVNKVFLTLVGGGAFGNPSHWIFDSLRGAIQKFQTCPLDIRIVSYGSSNAQVQQFIHSLSA